MFAGILFCLFGTVILTGACVALCRGRIWIQPRWRPDRARWVYRSEEPFEFWTAALHYAGWGALAIGAGLRWWLLQRL